MLESTIAVASDGLLSPSPYITLSAATRGYVLSSVVIEQPPKPKPPLGPSGRGMDARYQFDHPDEVIFMDDEEIVAILIAATINGVLK